MSPNTVTQPAFEIREGLTGSAGGGMRRFIDGVVAGQIVATAIEVPVEAQRATAHRWLLVTYPDIACVAGVEHPTSLPLAGTEDQIRPWVEFFTALYAKAISAAEGLQ